MEEVEEDPYNSLGVRSYGEPTAAVETILLSLLTVHSSPFTIFDIKFGTSQQNELLN